MSALEKKAQTFLEIAQDVLQEKDELDFLAKAYAQEKDENLTSDAQKLKRKLNEPRVLLSDAQPIERELDALKQKLRELLADFPTLVEEDAKQYWHINVHDPDAVSGFLYEVSGWKERLEKLLGGLVKP